MTSAATYTRFELLRAVRNTQSFIFTLLVPAVLFLTIAGPNRHQSLQDIPFPTYYMVGMASYGAMIAALSGGARIAAERNIGWTRQLRLTPLRPRVYFGGKVLTSYLMAALAIAVLYICGFAYGVRISPVRWLEMTALILIGLVPFAALGIVLGHILNVDATGPAMAGLSFVFGFLGGQWFPLPDSGVLVDIAQWVPSYWLTQAAHIGVGGSSWGAQAWIVLIVWTVVAAQLAVVVYRRDTVRA